MSTKEKTDEERIYMKEKPDVIYIPIDRIHTFEGHPYKVEDNADMAELTDSIRKNGVLSPVILRPLDNKPGEYEAISGHRRLFAAKKAGLETVPAFVYELDRDMAIIAMVDSNLHRDRLLPSEKAFAYKMKLDALKHRGEKGGQNVHAAGRKTRDVIAEDAPDSGRHIQRYIRLTYLVPDLLNLVDNERVAMSPAVSLSYLTDEEQGWVLDEMGKFDCSPSASQANTLKQKSLDCTLTRDFVEGLLCQEKANQKECLRIPTERLQGKLPEELSEKQKEDFVVKACEFYRLYLQKHKQHSL